MSSANALLHYKSYINRLTGGAESGMVDIPIQHCKLKVMCMIKHRDQYGIDESKRFVSCSETTDFNYITTLNGIKIDKVKSVSHIKVKGASIVASCSLHITPERFYVFL